jgi:hypothetical protein
MACQTPKDLNLYPIIGKKEMKSIDAKYQAEVGYWAHKNFLHDYKIYVMVICMFDDDFFNSLQQPLGDNPWLVHLTNQNQRTQFLR